MKIIYKNQDGSVCIIHPMIEALELMTIEEIALKDVPHGIAFAIVQDEEIPTDRTFRNAWEIEDSSLIDGVGADYGSGSDNILLGYDEDRNPVVVDTESYMSIVKDES